MCIVENKTCIFSFELCRTYALIVQYYLIIFLHNILQVYLITWARLQTFLVFLIVQLCNSKPQGLDPYKQKILTYSITLNLYGKFIEGTNLADANDKFFTYYVMEETKTSKTDHGNILSAFAVHKWPCLCMTFFMCTHYSMCILDCFTYFLHAHLHVRKEWCMQPVPQNLHLTCY